MSGALERNAVLAYLDRRVFEHIQANEAWLRSVREAAARGAVVYVLRNESLVDVLALEHLVRRHHLPPIRFAQDTNLGLLEPLGRGWFSSLLPRGETVAQRLERALSGGGSALLFLKRPPSLWETSRSARMRGKTEGDEALKALIDLQQRKGSSVLLVPQTFIWSRRPDSRGAGVIDLLLGPREYPGTLRMVTQFLLNFRSVDFRSGEVLDLEAFLREAGPDEDREALTRRLTYALLTRLERERRAILGPAKKPADRIREEVLRSPKLQATIRELAGDDEGARLLLSAKAYRMLRDLEAAPSHEGHQAIKAALEAMAERVFGNIEVDQEGIERVREAAKQGTVVLLPSHKSHMDYLLLSNALADARIQLPLIAAGDNLAFFPLGPLFRRGGAFFIRRTFKGDRLYTAVVDAYLRRLVRDGHAIEFFLEGGRSRTGKLLAPKTGLLGMVCEAALSLPHRKVFFFPVSLGYERLLEERSYLRELAGGEKRQENAGSLLRGTQVLRGFYGNVNVQFGKAFTLEQVRAEMKLPQDRALTNEERKSLVTRLAHLVMAEINRVTSVTPAALVAMVLLSGGRRGIPWGDLLLQSQILYGALQRRDVRFSGGLQRGDGQLQPEALRQALRLFVRAELCQERVVIPGEDPIYTVPDDRRMALSLSKNSILHFFIAEALVAAAMLGLSPTIDGVNREDLGERVQQLSRLFKYEFMFRADKGFSALFDETLERLAEEGVVQVHGVRVIFGEGRDGFPAERLVRELADLLLPYLLGYWAAARSLVLLVRGPLPRREVVRKAMAVGERMYLSGEISRREALARPTMESALRIFQDLGYLQEEGGKLALVPPYKTQETVGLIEGKLQALVPQEIS
ncbi:MAG: 1-acyl-sn-glycerol-3-phosphate acyltransferase [Myxococcales bacterium]|nr:1-acyl-sn-glycerol-3-phosphate acyltransferase [Polyangiaceae bacterium]MDW8248914.1 1-acyl-sn-glycerol-3-phosphate acyltransferase [Myxococcales bacterium]